MRIAMLAPLAESVPPKLYGGTERVVAWLVDELVARSATMSHCSRAETLGPRESSIRCGQGRSGSVERAQTRAPPAPFLWKRLPNAPPILTSSTPTSTGYRSHCSAGSECRFSLRRMVRLDLPGLPDVVREFCKAGFVSISDNQRRHLPEAKWIATIYHGLPSSLFRASYGQGSYLAFLGRLTAEKGPEDAIRIAEAVGMPLRIAAKIPRAETAYFKKQLQPHIDGERVTLVGEVDDAKKQPFLASAAALLFPIDWPEPFGLVMIEAMACGTPVIAYRSGSVPEVVEDGVTGFIVDGEEDAVRAVRELPRLDRRTIRARFEERFTAVRMAREYEARYRDLVANAEAEAPVLETASAK